MFFTSIIILIIINTLHAVMLRDSSVAILNGCKCARGVVGSEYDSHTSVLSSYPGSVTFFLTFFFLFIVSFFAHELSM